MTDAIPCGIAVGLAAAAAITDWRDGTIPNYITLPPLLAAPAAYLFLGGPSQALASVIGAVICGLVPYILFRRGAMGGGDVKLLAAIGAVAGLSIGLEGQLFALILAAVWALGMTALRGRLGTLLQNAMFLMVNPIMPGRWKREVGPDQLTSLRLGSFIFVGVSLSFTLRFVVLA